VVAEIALEQKEVSEISRYVMLFSLSIALLPIRVKDTCVVDKCDKFVSENISKFLCVIRPTQ
jgi:hypothetical protein